MTPSQKTPAAKGTGPLNDCRMYGIPPTSPAKSSNGPNFEAGRRRSQYRPTSTGPRIMSAFWAASQPG